MTLLANFGDNENGGCPNNCTCFSNVFMINHAFPIYELFPSNFFNATKISLSMRIKFAWKSQKTSSHTLYRTSHTFFMALLQWEVHKELTNTSQYGSMIVFSITSHTLTNRSTMKLCGKLCFYRVWQVEGWLMVTLKRHVVCLNEWNNHF